MHGAPCTMTFVSEGAPPSQVEGRPETRKAGNAFSRGLSRAAAALVGHSTRIFGDLADRGNTALADFRARPEHSRWRAYALGSYGVIAMASVLAQLYSANPLDAYVRVQPVELPALTQIFVRNDSHKAWRNVRLTLNGIYG